MKKILLVTLFLFSLSILSHAQVVSEASHKIIYQLTDGDSHETRTRLDLHKGRYLVLLFKNV